MALTFYDYTVPTIQSALVSLKHILTKAQAHAHASGEDDQSLIQARIHPDMYALPFQVWDVCTVSDRVRALLQGQEELGLEDNMRTFDDFYKRIDQVAALVDAIDRDKFNEYAEKQVPVDGKPGARTMRGADVVRDFLMPNLWFHLTTAYDIMRKEGIPLGKMDFIGAWVNRKA